MDDPEQFARISTYVRPELLGALAVPLGGPVRLHHSLSEAVFVDGVAAVQLLARWGVVGPQMTLDPMLPVSDKPSWLLDIDVSQTAPVEYDPAVLTDMVGSFAERVYRFFRSMTCSGTLEVSCEHHRHRHPPGQGGRLH